MLDSPAFAEAMVDKRTSGENAEKKRIAGGVFWWGEDVLRV